MNTTMTTTIQFKGQGASLPAATQSRCQAFYVESTQAQIELECKPVGEGDNGNKKPLSSVPVISGPGGCGLI